MKRPRRSLPRWGFGGAPIGALADTDRDHVAAALSEAISFGATLIDTSPFYGNGRSETLIGSALQGLPRSAYMLSTKVGNDAWDPIEGTTLALDPDAMMRSVERSLQRLGTDYVDVLHLHEPGIPNPQSALDGRIEQVFGTLHELRAQGVVHRIGAGLNDVRLALTLLEQTDLDCLLLAGRYTLLDQSGQEVIEACRDRGVEYIAAGIYNSGILATGPGEGATFEYALASGAVLSRARELDHLCASWGVSLHVAASQYPALRDGIDTVIFGATSTDEVDAFIAACDFDTPAGFWGDIADLHARWALTDRAT